jgi:hypothetical protein
VRPSTSNSLLRAPLRRACLVVAALAFAASAAGIGVRGSRGAQTTGDEPHYLTTAISLAEDGDLDVRDELEQRLYTSFHAPTLSPQERVLGDGRMVSPHDPLLPALLAVPLALGGWAAAKLVLALLAGANAALLLWTAVARLGVPLRAAALAAGLFATSSPLAVYGSQVYPELVAALLVTAAVAGVATPLAVVALPWLSVKYAAVAGVAALPGLRRRPRLLLVYAGAAAAFLLAHRALYGGWTPYAAGDHFAGGELTVVGHDPDYLGRSRRLLGLLVDRTFGLAAWQPAWLLVVPALATLAASRPPWWIRVALPLAVGWLVATFVALTMHGWWWPGRQVVVVLPLAVLAIAWWAARSRRNERLLLALGSLGVATYLWFVVEAYWSGLTWVVDFYETSNPLYRVWRLVLPDFWQPGAATWPLAGAWAAALAGAAAYEYTGTRRAWGSRATRAPSGTTSVDGRWETSTLPSTSTR